MGCACSFSQAHACANQGFTSVRKVSYLNFTKDIVQRAATLICVMAYLARGLHRVNPLLRLLSGFCPHAVPSAKPHRRQTKPWRTFHACTYGSLRHARMRVKQAGSAVDMVHVTPTVMSISPDRNGSRQEDAHFLAIK